MAESLVSQMILAGVAAVGFVVIAIVSLTRRR